MGTTLQPPDEMTNAVSGGRIAEVSEDAFGETGHVFEVHRLPLSVGAHDEIVEAERELDDGIEARKGAIAGPHFFDHDAAVPRPEDVHHATREDAFSEPLGCALDRRQLRFDRINQFA